jgi:hypothetical protein
MTWYIFNFHSFISFTSFCLKTEFGHRPNSVEELLKTEINRWRLNLVFEIQLKTEIQLLKTEIQLLKTEFGLWNSVEDWNSTVEDWNSTVEDWIWSLKFSWRLNFNCWRLNSTVKKTEIQLKTEFGHRHIQSINKLYIFKENQSPIVWEMWLKIFITFV